jgi:hypothetical protein
VSIGTCRPHERQDADRTQQQNNLQQQGSKPMLLPTFRGRQVAARTAHTARARRGLQQGRDGAGVQPEGVSMQCSMRYRALNATGHIKATVAVAAAFHSLPALQAGGGYSAFIPHTHLAARQSAHHRARTDGRTAGGDQSGRTARSTARRHRRRCGGMVHPLADLQFKHKQHQRVSTRQNQTASSEAEYSRRMAAAPAVHQNWLLKKTTELVPVPATAMLHPPWHTPQRPTYTLLLPLLQCPLHLSLQHLPTRTAGLWIAAAAPSAHHPAPHLLAFPRLPLAVSCTATAAATHLRSCAHLRPRGAGGPHGIPQGCGGAPCHPPHSRGLGTPAGWPSPPAVKIKLQRRAAQAAQATQRSTNRRVGSAAMEPRRRIQQRQSRSGMRARNDKPGGKQYKPRTNTQTTGQHPAPIASTHPPTCFLRSSGRPAPPQAAEGWAGMERSGCVEPA